MNNRGQVFTLDMLFALVLIALVVGCSGQAFELATKKTGDYSTRYSLERVANDASDVLAKTVGKPYNWEEDITMLETLGLSEFDEFTGKALQNTLDVGKLGQLKISCENSNWNPSKPEVKSIMDFFGGTSNFELTVIDGATRNTLWDIWPRWDNQVSGAENSPDVAAASRAITVKYGDIRADSGQLRKGHGENKIYTVWFEILPGELDMFDWYIIVKTSDIKNQQVDHVHIYVNRSGKHPHKEDYKAHFHEHRDDWEQTFPDVHGGVEADPGVEENLHEGWNFLGVKIDGGKHNAWAEVYVIAVPSCTPPDIVNLETGQRGRPGTLELKLWR